MQTIGMFEHHPRAESYESGLGSQWLSSLTLADYVPMLLALGGFQCWRFWLCTHAVMWYALQDCPLIITASSCCKSPQPIYFPTGSGCTDVTGWSSVSIAVNSSSPLYILSPGSRCSAITCRSSISIVPPSAQLFFLKCGSL